MMLRDDRSIFARAQLPRLAIRFPRPDVAKPQLRQHMQRRFLRPAIVNRDAHQNVFRRRLRVFDEHIQVAVVVEDAGVEQLKFRQLRLPLRRAFSSSNCA